MAVADHLLVVTPTLGDSEFLNGSVQAVSDLELRTTHVISCPAKKVAELRARFPHCVVVPDAGREGAIYGALNAALEQAPNDWDWFTYINDDDELTPGFAEMARLHFQRPNGEPVTYGDVRVIAEDGTPISLITTERTPRYIAPLLQQGISPMNQQGMLFRADVVRELKRFDTRYKLCADLDFWLRAYASGHAFRYYPLEVGKFRIREGQLSGNVELTVREQQDVVSRALPVRASAMMLRWARLRYRLLNLPRYLERSRVAGWSTSNALLSRGIRKKA
jgi:Glycosyltransferase like family 2